MSNTALRKAQKEIGNWLNTYGNDLYSWAYYKTSSKETAEDLVQETLISAFKAFDKFRPGSNPKTWLLTILNNKIIDYYRASNTNKSFNQSQLQGQNLENDNYDSNGIWKKQEVSLWSNKDEHLLDNAEFLEVLNKCVSALPENWRRVIISKYFDHKKGKDICKELDITSSNLWQMAHRAKLQLKTCLNKNWNTI